MKWFIFLSFTLCTGLANVILLTDENIEETIKKNMIVMVKFFAPWCGHCRAMAPEYQKAAQEAKEQNLPYVIAELDATTNIISANTYGIHGFPTIKLFYKDQILDYNGERNADAILSFIKKSTGPISTELQTVEKIKEQKKGSKLRCILSADNKENIETYEAVAKTQDICTFFHAASKLVKAVFPKVEEGNVVLLRDFEEPIVVFSQKLTKENLHDFLLVETLPLVSNITQRVFDQVFTSKERIGVFLVHSPDDVHSADYQREFLEVAKGKKSKELVFIENDLSGNLGKNLADHLVIESQSLPYVLVVNRQNETQKLLYAGPIKKDAIEEFLQMVKKGTAKRYYKEEPVPKENPGPVYKVVRATFQHQVLDNTDDVVLKFYAPWCGHCKRLSPIYERLAQTMEKMNKNLKFMEVDGTKNDIKDHELKGYPTVKLFPGKNKTDVHTFSGDLTAINIANFIQEHGSHELIIPAFLENTCETIEVDDL